MLPPPPISTRPDTLCPFTTLFRSARRRRTCLATRRQAGAAVLEGYREGAHRRLPRLRLHAHAVGGFRRADDALRRNHAAAVEAAAARRDRAAPEHRRAQEIGRAHV